MAHENLRTCSALARGAAGVLAALTFVSLAQAQRADPNRICVTRYQDGRAITSCRPSWTAKKKKSHRRAYRQGSGSSGPISVEVPQTESRPGAAPSDAPAAANGASAGSRRPAALHAVRALAEPAEMPPRGVAGYGVVAFTTRPLAHDIERYKLVCEAYKAALVSTGELRPGTPLSEQMITFWPILDKSAPQAQRVECDHLVRNYALRVGLEAIQDADKQREGLASRRGPFLVAWAPSESRFVPDAVVLVMDLSSFDSQRSFAEVFQEWRQKIVDNPQLGRRGFDIEAVRRTIRDTFDRYGDGLMRLIKAGS
jgi:hypothetical protein